MPLRSRGVGGDREHPVKRVHGTLFAPTALQLTTIREVLAKHCRFWAIGHHVGRQSGKRHIHVYADFSIKKRPIHLFDIPALHLESAKGTKEQNYAYLAKDGSIESNYAQAIITDDLQGVDLYRWQQKLEILLKSPVHKREVNWIYCDSGNTGKTVFARHVCMMSKSLIVGGKASDIKFGISEFIKTHGYIESVFINVVRSQEEFVSYEAIEAIKDGIFFSSKYESGMVIFNRPHVVVFANFAPKKEKLSFDRWVINKIDPVTLDYFEENFIGCPDTWGIFNY